MDTTRTVLVIEDEAILQTVLYEVLSDEGYDVLQAYDGAQGLDLAMSRRPDLIILDFGLPVHSGADILARLKARDVTRRIPVVAMTGLPALLEGGPLPLDGWIPKPFDIDALLMQVDRLAELPPSIQQRPPAAHVTQGGARTGTG